MASLIEFKFTPTPELLLEQPQVNSFLSPTESLITKYHENTLTSFKYPKILKQERVANLYIHSSNVTD